MSLTIKPSYRQFLADNIGFVTATTLVTCITPCGIYLHVHGGIPFVDASLVRYARAALAVIAFMMWMAVFYRYALLASRSWVIKKDTIKSQYGIFAKKVDYIELYRVVDYQESQSFLQRLLGVKTVEILSTDRSDPSLLIFGIPSDMNLVETIRQNVEACKHENKIFEVANSIS